MEAEKTLRYWEKDNGVAPIKAEYVLWDKLARSGRSRQHDDDAAEGRTKAEAPPTRTTVDATPATDNDAQPAAAAVAGDEDVPQGDEPPSKKVKLSNEDKKELRKERKAAAREQADADKAAAKKQKQRGANHGRTFGRTGEETKLCSFTAVEKPCERQKQGGAEGENGSGAGLDKETKEEKESEKQEQQPKRGKGRGRGGRGGWGDGCRFTHDIPTYLASKPPDILSHLDLNFTSDSARSSAASTAEESGQAEVGSFPVPNPTSVPVCPLFREHGECTFGYRCRFLSSHVAKFAPSLEGSSATNGILTLNAAAAHGASTTAGLSLVSSPEKIASFAASLPKDHTKTAYRQGETNYLSVEALRLLRKRKYKLEATKKYLDSIGEPVDQRNLGKQRGRGKPKGDQEEPAEAAEESDGDDKAVVNGDQADDTPDAQVIHSSVPTASNSTSDVKDRPIDLAAPRPAEKPRLHWGKSSPSLYLAPLTTVGNLPFRRLCTTLGADITCGEMALSQDLLQASPSEWSLVRRWKDERCFGTQIAGSRAQLLVPTAEVLSRECELDFVDLNCGCPIDLVFKKGAGSALLDHATKLGRSLVGMSRILNAQGIPLTAKLRTGVSDGHPTAHKLLARTQGEWGVSAVTLHGRSRQQRYSKRADWSYIANCVKVVRNKAEELGEEPIPIYGNGDCYDYREYYEDVEQSGATGVMLARGALIKPWLFTEIKERRDWDISARERLDLYGKLASFGLQHWGSDTQGINTTRRFLCEAISFQYRYIPVGLLERLPARINERPLPFKGRDELETLLASPASEDWVKISNLFLGPPPEHWSFTPKHKSNAHGGEEGNG